MKGSAQFLAETDESGRFIRQGSHFRGWVRADGSSEYRAESGRYHLFVSYACPWAHRTIIVRKLKGLEEAVSLSVVDPIRDELGWAFRDVPGAQLDPINGWGYLSEYYLKSDPSFSGRVTVPVLWDRESGSIVSNESEDILRMLNAEFNGFATNPELDLYPESLRSEIDEINDFVYGVNNGVYRAGFATTQFAYEEAVFDLFQRLDQLEARLERQRYLVGSQITEADWRLFTTLLRFDPVYVGHFKCNIRRLADYPNLWAYTRDLYQQPGVAATVNMDHIKRHYYVTHRAVNPSGVVPVGPEIDFTQAHRREGL